MAAAITVLFASRLSPGEIPGVNQPETVIKEINAAVRAGFKEIVLTGVQLGSWGKDLDPGLALE